MITHELKIEPQYLENLKSGRKTFEIRFNDRDYQLGDYLKFSDADGLYYYEISHIHSGLGLKEGWVVLSLKTLVEIKDVSAGAFVECENCNGTGKITFWHIDCWEEKLCEKCKGSGGKIIGFDKYKKENRE